MTRSMAIKWLKWIQNMFPEDSEQYKALQLGIDSMEVDEAYQLMYEGEDIYTKADMVAMLKELKEQLREMHEDYYETEHFDEAYGVSDSMDIIQEKINALRGEEE